MDEQYLVDVDKQPIRNAIFRTLAGALSAASLFVIWSDSVRIYEAGWAHFDISSGLSILVSVFMAMVMGSFALGGYTLLGQQQNSLDNGLQRLLDPNYKADVSSLRLGQQVHCPRWKKYRRLFYAERGLRPWR